MKYSFYNDKVSLIHGDSTKVLKELPDNHFDSIVTDAPYHLTSIVKRFGKEGSAPAQFGKDGAFARASKGFMGKEWDGGDLAFQPEFWYEVGRVLKPGGHLVAFLSFTQLSSHGLCNRRCRI
jgi:DNA modification methylase